MNLTDHPRKKRPTAKREGPAAAARVSLRDQLDELTNKVRRYNPQANISDIETAFVGASSAHDGQRRRSGDPYLMHPLAVAQIIADLKLDVPSICAGLLHDCVEDTEVTRQQIAEKYSEEVAFLVDGVTKLGRLPWNTREERQAENFRKMLVAMAKDIRVILIKLADRLHNMRTLEHMSEDGQERIARETMDIYAPLANRLGIYWLRAELEDLSFRYLHPNEYRPLIEQLAASEQERAGYVTEVEGILRNLMDDNDILCEVTGRRKNLWGIYDKMHRTQRTLDQIHDVVAFRIMTGNIRDCYAALGVVHEKFTPVPGQFKDYVAMPKPNQYQSLHTSLIGPRRERMEVQIRTKDMHRVCEEGIAAHWVYKEGQSLLSRDDQQKFAWLRQLVEFQRDLHDPAEFIDAVKIDLFSDEVYVFTPQGDVKAFPTGATPVDFAFAIHTEVGLHCAGARVNGQIVPLRYRLQNGDTVEIITNARQKPSKDWLKACSTARARSKIRHFIRREQRERGRTLGREMLDRILRTQGTTLAKLEKGDELDKVASQLRVGNRLEDLLMQIGIGKITPLQVIRVLYPDVQEEEPQPGKNPIMRIFQRMRRRYPQSGIRVQGEDDVLVRYAHCCNPLPGDAISGFITRGRGVTVHKIDCEKSLDLDPERRIEVSWDAEARVDHPVRVSVQAMDKPGLLAEMTKVFSDQGVDIAQANCRVTRNGRAVNTFHVHVGHLDHLKQVVRAIKRIKGVHAVERL